MSKGRRLALAGGAAVAAGFLVAAAPAAAGPEAESIWEEGTVTSISDGDTLVANLTAGSGARGSNRIRTVGVQAPEVAHNGTLAECGSAQATDRLRAQLPVGSTVQTRSVSVDSQDSYSSGRIVRSLYAQDEEGNWYDTSRPTVSEGWMLWFPLAADSKNKPEWAHNLEYRVLADDAAGAGRGLWTANLCGPWQHPEANLRTWVFYTQDGAAQPERAFIENNGAGPVDVSAWTIRDSALNYFRIPVGTVIGAGQILEVQFNTSGQLQPAWPGTSILVAANTGAMGFNNLPANNAYFEGDSLYLMDASGPYSTGNLRSWFPYPCNPDTCGDVLKDVVRITGHQVVEPPSTAPSAPRAVGASARTDGSGIADITWEAPTATGGSTVTNYAVTATPVSGGATPAVVNAGTALSAAVPGLTLGKAYTFTVRATNGVGSSGPSLASGAVTPKGAPAQVAKPNVAGFDATSVIVSWATPNDNGAQITSYTVTNASGGTVGSKTCTTGNTEATVGVTSCRVSGLTAIPYTFIVTATNSLGSSAASTASNTITPTAYTPGGSPLGKPTGVVGVPRINSAVVSWSAPANDGGNQIIKYTVNNATGGTPNTKSCTTGDAPTANPTSGVLSCLVTGLANGTAYTFKVTATTSATTSESDASASVTPAEYIDGESLEPGTGGGTVPDPWVPGQFIDLTNTGGSVAKLGGYGFWDKDSAAGATDNHEYLFPANQTIQPGQTLRVHFGTAITRPSPANTTVLEGGATFINPADDYVELANLNRSVVACTAFGAATCRSASPTAVSTSPVGVTARTTASSVTVSWGAPISRGGTAITGYTATAFNASVGGTPVGSCAAGGGDRACSFPAAVGTQYFVEVVAQNAVGTSAPSWRVLATPKSVPASPGSVTAAGGKGTVSVAWVPGAANGRPITSFTARAYRSGTGGGASGSCTSGGGGCTISGLAKGTTYYVDVTATNRVGEGPASSPRVAATTTGFTTAVTTYSKSKVTVRWNRVDGVTSYQARVYDAPAGGKLLGSCNGKATASKCTTKKVKKKKLYYVDLTLVSATGAQTVVPRIVTGPARKASPPTAVTASAVATKVTINWDDPVFNGYSILKSYSGRVYSKAKGGKVLAKCSASATRYSCTTKATKKLKKGKTYWVTAAVKNGKGWSKYAAPRLAITIQ